MQNLPPAEKQILGITEPSPAEQLRSFLSGPLREQTFAMIDKAERGDIPVDECETSQIKRALETATENLRADFERGISQLQNIILHLQYTQGKVELEDRE